MEIADDFQGVILTIPEPCRFRESLSFEKNKKLRFMRSVRPMITSCVFLIFSTLVKGVA